MLKLPGGWPPGSGGGQSFIGFKSIFTWSVFTVVLVGVSYYDSLQPDEDEVPRAPGVPSDVARVLPSGAWLMNDGTIRKPQK